LLYTLEECCGFGDSLCLIGVTEMFDCEVSVVAPAPRPLNYIGDGQVSASHRYGCKAAGEFRSLVSFFYAFVLYVQMNYVFAKQLSRNE